MPGSWTDNRFSTGEAAGALGIRRGAGQATLKEISKKKAAGPQRFLTSGPAAMLVELTGQVRFNKIQHINILGTFK